MSDLDLGALKALAEKAIPGPWVVTGGDNDLYGVDAQDDYVTLGDSTLPLSDAEFIAAANPVTVLALIERVKRAEAVGCTCGFGGFHDDINPRCALSRHENGATDA